MNTLEFALPLSRERRRERISFVRRENQRAVDVSAVQEADLDRIGGEHRPVGRDKVVGTGGLRPAG